MIPFYPCPIESLRCLNFKVCRTCGSENHLTPCSTCKCVQYCSNACKDRDREEHTNLCNLYSVIVFPNSPTGVSFVFPPKKLPHLCATKNEFSFPPPARLCDICTNNIRAEKESLGLLCCGKEICNGCNLDIRRHKLKPLCPFCKGKLDKPVEYYLDGVKARADKGDGGSLFLLSRQERRRGDEEKELALLKLSSEAGYSLAHNNLGTIYFNGSLGVNEDMAQALKFYLLAAKSGHAGSMFGAAKIYWQNGNKVAALAHLVISSALGHDDSLAFIELLIKGGDITLGDNYLQLIKKALREYKALCDSPSKSVASALAGRS